MSTEPKNPPRSRTNGTPPPARAVKEWVGRTPDSKVPPRVRVRVFDRYDGRDYETGQKITPADKWECDHLIAIANGGENRESNLVPRLKAKHKEKTAKDMAAKKRGAAARKRHLGVKQPSKRWKRNGEFTPTPTKYIDRGD